MKILKNESGSAIMIVAATLMAIISAVSAWALVGMVGGAELQTQLFHDAIQEELFLRSEAKRIHLSIEINNSTTNPPDRTGEDMLIVPRTSIYSDDIPATKYEIVNKSEKKNSVYFMGIATDQVVAIKSKITATHKYREYINKRFVSPVVRVTEKLIRNNSLAQYQYFTDVEASENSENGDDIVRFYGADVLDGPVHSNDDIWIRNLSGWPTFNSLVTTTGYVYVYPSGDRAIYAAPVEDIFLEGLIEEAPEEVFMPDASELKANATYIGDNANIDIVYVEMNGYSMEVMYGMIVNEGVTEHDVYSWYPNNENAANAIISSGGNWFEDTNVVWTNETTMYDTIWSSGGTYSSSNLGKAYYVPNAELWIKGSVGGKLTWGCGKRIYIVGDITYNSTIPGNPPDNPDDPNLTDFFGLVSEERIYIRYKYYDPMNDMQLNNENCTDIRLYGAYAAIGDGDDDLYGVYNCHYEGIFSFEYQHPHGSTPNFESISPYTYEDTIYTYIDLHKFVFPISGFLPPAILGFNLHGGPPPAGYPCCGYPYEASSYQNSFPNNNSSNYVYPYGTDYPWYNPVWPESSDDIVFLRGTIHNWGSIAQRRRGFVRRSGEDPYNHPSNNEWKLDETTFHYDGEHDATGYDKDYYFDNRLTYIQPPYYPQIYENQGQGLSSTFQTSAWSFLSPKDW